MAAPHFNEPNHERLDPPNPLAHFVLPTAEHSAISNGKANGSINAVYAQGISFIDEAGAMGGFLAIIGGAGIALFGGALYAFIQAMGWRWIFLPFMGMAFVSVFILRADTIGHRYQPVLFNRAIGKVHLFVSEPPKWWQLWRWMPGYRIETYDWSCIRGEVVEITQIGGSGIPRKDYGLTCAVVESPGSQKVIARFGVGLGYPWASQPIVQMWEHIRLFMRNKGPHVAPGDSVFVDQNITSFWSSLWFMQPLIGPGSKQHWTGEPFEGKWYFTIAYGVVVLPLVPFTMAAGLLRWLTHKARREPKWPAEIMASVGGAIDTNAPRITWTQRRKALKQKP